MKPCLDGPFYLIQSVTKFDKAAAEALLALIHALPGYATFTIVEKK